MPERVTHAAIMHYCVIVTGNDYAACLSQLPPKRNKKHETRGYYTSKGRFISRQEALDIAQRNRRLNLDAESAVAFRFERQAVG